MRNDMMVLVDEVIGLIEEIAEPSPVTSVVVKDKYNRTPEQIKRIYGEKAKELFGTDLPTPLQIQEYKKEWSKKALNANQFIPAKRIKQLKICLWLRERGLSKLDYVVRYGAFRSEPDLIIIKDPKLCVLAKLQFSG